MDEIDKYYPFQDDYQTKTLDRDDAVFIRIPPVSVDTAKLALTIETINSPISLSNGRCNERREPETECQPLRIATRQETFDAIQNNQALKDAKVWRDSIVTFSPIGLPRRKILTLRMIEELKKLKAKNKAIQSSNALSTKAQTPPMSEST